MSQAYALATALVTAALTLTFQAKAGPPPASTGVAKVVVKVAGARNNLGEVTGALWRDCPGFPRDRSGVFLRDVANVKGGVAILEFSDVPYGIVAATVLHDENKSGDADENMLGLPVEGFGFSRNPGVMMGAPRFQEASFEINQAVVNVEIKLKYL